MQPASRRSSGRCRDRRSASSPSGCSSGRSISPPPPRSCARPTRPGSRSCSCLPASTSPRAARRWQRPPPPDRGGPVPARPRLHYHRLSRQQHPAGAARRAGPEPLRSASGRASSRTTVLGTVVVERVVDTSWSSRSRPCPSLVLSVRGVDDERGPARARVRGLLLVGSRSGSWPIGCPGADRVAAFVERWPRVVELAGRLRDGLAVAAGRGRWPGRSRSAPSRGSPRSSRSSPAARRSAMELTMAPGGAHRQRAWRSHDRPVGPGLPRDVRVRGRGDRPPVSASTATPRSRWRCSSTRRSWSSPRSAAVIAAARLGSESAGATDPPTGGGR